MPGHIKNVHKLGLVPIMNRGRGTDGPSLANPRPWVFGGTPQFGNWDLVGGFGITMMSNLQGELSRNYGMVFDDSGNMYYTDDGDDTLYLEAAEQIDYCEETDRFIQNKKSTLNEHVPIRYMV
tara:strand:+ start:571 stop:939 length:369 start_codon:yes stop_codon:yes gene_type:complete